MMKLPLMYSFSSGYVASSCSSGMKLISRLHPPQAIQRMCMIMAPKLAPEPQQNLSRFPACRRVLAACCCPNHRASLAVPFAASASTVANLCGVGHCTMLPQQTSCSLIQHRSLVEKNAFSAIYNAHPFAPHFTQQYLLCIRAAKAAIP